MKKNNSLVKNVVNFSFSGPFKIIVITIIIISLIKDNTKKVAPTMDNPYPKNTIQDAIRQKINQVGQTIEMNEAIQQKQKQKLRPKKNTTMINDNLKIELTIINNSNKKVNKNKYNIIITDVKLTEDEPLTKFLLDKEIGYEITIPFASLEKDKNSFISQKSVEYQLFYKIKILGIEYDNY